MEAAGARRAFSTTFTFALPCAFVLVVASAADPEANRGAALGTNAIFLLLAVAVGTIVHEAAHAGMARVCRFTIVSIVLGCGPVVREMRIGATRLVVHAIPVTGLVQATMPTTRWLRTRLAAFFAAGSLANAGLVVACLPWIALDDGVAPLATRPSPVLAFAVVNAMYTAFNLFPLPPMRARGRRQAFAGNDGWKLLAAPFRSRDDLQALLATHAVLAATRALGENRVAEAKAIVEEAHAKDPTSKVVQVAHTDVLLRMSKWTEAIPFLRALLTDRAWRRSSPRAVPLLANNLAWALFRTEDPACLEEADRWSKEALADAPDNFPFQGTRGAVLVARGRLDEAEPLLASAFAGSAAAAKGRNACSLALLHSQRGNRDEALRWLDEARAAKAEPTLLARTETRLLPRAEDEVGANDAALAETLRALAIAVLRLQPGVAANAERILESAVTPSALGDVLASQLDVPLDERARIFATPRVAVRLSRLVGAMARQLELLEMRARLHPNVSAAVQEELARPGAVRPSPADARTLVRRHQKERLVQAIEDAGHDVDHANLGVWVTTRLTGHPAAAALANPSALADADDLPAALSALRESLRDEVHLQQLGAILREDDEVPR